ncbi:MAG: LptA/OstA family protein, partial [Armatimonadota bacterium]
KGEVDNKKKIAVFFGPVEVIIKPKKEEPEKAKKEQGSQPEAEAQKEGKREGLRERVRREGGKMVCDRAEYYYRERRVVATGNVKFEQEGRYSGKADKVTYLTRDEILTIEGNVVMRDLRKGHEVECPKIVINLQTDQVDISPPVSGRLIVREEEEEQKPQQEKEEQKTQPEKVEKESEEATK